VLDPIDGTRGFLNYDDALYVVSYNEDCFEFLLMLFILFSYIRVQRRHFLSLGLGVWRGGIWIGGEERKRYRNLPPYLKSVL
jgi:hypothetical protein